MPKLSDSQRIILSAAARRQDGTVLPLPRSLKVNKAAAVTLLKSLLKKGLLEEKPAMRNSEAWREADGGRRMMLVITEAGLDTLGVDADRVHSGRRATVAVPRGAEEDQRP